jgi:YVTN family beta-propeller protein
MDRRPARAYTTYTSAARRSGSRRRCGRGGAVVLAAVLLAIVAVAATTAVLLTRGGEAIGGAGGGDEGAGVSVSVSPDSSASSTRTSSPSPSPRLSESPSPAPGSAAAWTGPPSYDLRMKLVYTIGGGISPKSVVATQTGYVFAQNMMYTHTVTVYDAQTYKLVKTIQDSVDLARFGVKGGATVRGAPVEAAVAADQSAVYVSNYSMYGPGYARPGDDNLGPGSGVDPSFVYRIGLQDLTIDEAIKVGSVPKFLATTPDGKLVLVSNWVSWDLSVIDVARGKEVRRMQLGAFPRGIAVDSRSRYAYVAVMGTGNIARLRLADLHLDWITGVGAGPRHLCISPNDRWLYVTLNAEGTVGKIDLRTRHLVSKVFSGSQTRSMTIAPDGKSLYVVNYESSSVSKIRAADMKIVQQVSTGWHPIGITYEAPTKSVWVACYGGSIMVFAEQ